MGLWVWEDLSEEPEAECVGDGHLRILEEALRAERPGKDVRAAPPKAAEERATGRGKAMQSRT